MSPPSPPSPDPSRLVAQRNAAVAAAFLLALVLVGAGYALEVMPQRAAARAQGQLQELRAEVAGLRAALAHNQRAFEEVARALAQSQPARPAAAPAPH